LCPCTAWEEEVEKRGAKSSLGRREEWGEGGFGFVLISLYPSLLEWQQIKLISLSHDSN